VRNRLLTPSRYWTAFEINRLINSSYRPRGREIEIEEEFHAVAGRINDSQARAGITWLARVAEIAAHRVACCEDYARRPGMAGMTPSAVDVTTPLYYYPVLVDRKTGLLDLARRNRAEVVAWPIRTPIYPVTDATALATYGYETGSCPEAERIAARLVGLPTHPLVRPEDRERIAGLVARHAAGRSS
jgi:dTDP-4-amino-4,6-dideoxygalactose transaminase